MSGKLAQRGELPVVAYPADLRLEVWLDFVAVDDLSVVCRQHLCIRGAGCANILRVECPVPPAHLKYLAHPRFCDPAVIM